MSDETARRAASAYCEGAERGEGGHGIFVNRLHQKGRNINSKIDASMVYLVIAKLSKT
jgi:hypothetical protein